MQCEERRSVMINALVNETEHDRCMISDLVINSDHRTRCECRRSADLRQALRYLVTAYRFIPERAQNWGVHPLHSPQ